MPYLREPDFRLKYDSVLRSIEVLKKINDYIAIVRAVVKGQFPVSDRDFITYVVLTQPDANVHLAHTDLCEPDL